MENDNEKETPGTFVKITEIIFKVVDCDEINYHAEQIIDGKNDFVFRTPDIVMRIKAIKSLRKCELFLPVIVLLNGTCLAMDLKHEDDEEVLNGEK